MEHQLSVLCLERSEQEVSFKEIHQERHGMLFTHYDWECSPYIEGRIKQLGVNLTDKSGIDAKAKAGIDIGCEICN